MRTKDWLVMVVIAAVVVLCVVAYLKQRSAQDECIDRGGIVHEYDCAQGGGNCRWQCVERR